MSRKDVPILLAVLIGAGLLLPPGVRSASNCYDVQPGDWLSRIALSSGLTLQDVERLNPQILNPNMISTGQRINLSPGACGPTENSVGNASFPLPEPTKTASSNFIDEAFHPNYQWQLDSEGIWYIDLVNSGMRSLYIPCSARSNPCLSFPKTEPTGYLTWVTQRQGKFVIQYQEGPGTGNHHGVSLSLGKYREQKPIETVWNKTGEIMRVTFADGSKADYKMGGLPGITGNRGKWNGVGNGRIEAVITETITATEIPFGSQ